MLYIEKYRGYDRVISTYFEFPMTKFHFHVLKLKKD